MNTKESQQVRAKGTRTNKSVYIHYSVFSFLLFLENIGYSFEHKNLFNIAFNFKLKVGVRKIKGYTPIEPNNLLRRKSHNYDLTSIPESNVQEVTNRISQLVSEGYQFTKMELKGKFIVKPTEKAQNEYAKTVIVALGEREASNLNWFSYWNSQMYLSSSEFKVDITSNFEY